VVVKERLIQLPIFPLPTSILYPGIFVPFHIFEERYKLMIQKVEETKSLLAVSYAPELQPNKFFPHMICGAGHVRVLQKFDNGEKDILVFGKQRVKFNRYIQEVPYLIGEGQILEINKDMPAATEAELLRDVKDMLINWIFTNFDDSVRPIQFFKNVVDLEPLCNFVAYYFVNDFEKKQKLLEEEILEVKAQAIWQVLKDMELSGSPGPRDIPLIFPKSTQKKGDDEPLN
jgi:Lon protease-like protein